MGTPGMEAPGEVMRHAQEDAAAHAGGGGGVHRAKDHPGGCAGASALAGRQLS
jgi:hypothetical protein